MRRGQTAVEYLTMVGIALSLLLPAAYYMLTFADNLSQQSQARRLNLAGSDILSGVREVYAAERGSFIVVDVILPDFFNNASIYTDTNHNMVTFTFATPNGPSDLLFFTQGIPISNGTTCSNTCRLPIQTGFNKLKIYNNGTSIILSEP